MKRSYIFFAAAVLLATPWVLAQEKPANTAQGKGGADVAAVSSPQAVAVDPISGTWSMTLSGGMIPEASEGTLDLRLGPDQKTVEGKITGGFSVGPDPEDVSLSGAFDGDVLTIRIEASDLPPGFNPEIRATLDAPNHLTGSFSVAGMDMTFEATRTKPLLGAAGPTAKKPAAKKKKKKTPEELRLEKLLTTGFDRRPSAILRAWSLDVAEVTSRARAAQIAAVGSDLTPEVAAAEIAALQSNVTVGRWRRVGGYMASLPAEHGEKAYAHLLQNLQTDGAPVKGAKKPKGGARPQRRAPGYAAFRETNRFSPEDLIGLADASPAPELDEEVLALLSKTLRKVVQQGHSLDEFLKRVEAGTTRLGGKEPKKRGAVATLLLDAGLIEHTGPFLPKAEDVKREGDYAALDLMVRYYLALNGKEKAIARLESAWELNLALLAVANIPEEKYAIALKRAVELAPKLREALGKEWFQERFAEGANSSRRGREVLAVIGSVTAEGRASHAKDQGARLANLELQLTAGSAFLERHPQARDWAYTLELLAGNWLTEAEFSIRWDTSSRPQYQRDRYGNVFFSEGGYRRQQQRNKNQPTPIPAADLLEARPPPVWLDLVRPSLRTRYSAALAKLHLKVQEEEEAFPYIERLAKTDPKEAHELAEEFLRVWTRNHDLNGSPNNRRNRYIYMWGFEKRANAIPLTRSKQERNLRELTRWIARLRRLPCEEVDEALLVEAFIRSHSSAEVYRLESLSRVFGDLSALTPKTLAKLIQTMRANLASVWRDPKVQEKKKTKRKDKEIQAEVLRGYVAAAQLTRDALAGHPNSWQLKLVRAALLHDRNAFQNKTLGSSSEFAAGQAEAFALFAQAAQAYCDQLSELPEEEESNEAFDLWFYASLGACDLGRITHEHRPAPRQALLIRDSLRSLPKEAAERHLARFANALFTRMNSVNPAVKFGYLEAGFSIVGDNKAAREAKQVFDYYKDLVTEIKLVTRIDGSDRVGYGEPFGLFVEIRHTKEIERESGGFQKYLKNQNQASFGFNYGRPTEDYRDKFEEAARAALEEQFEVLSLTFHDPKIQSRGTSEPGWRVTPYAYALLQARGPEVDKIPALRMDLDFLDTSGYAVLPIASAALPIDATPAKREDRPAAALQIVQTLDERRAGAGLLVLEIKATARGLVPALGDLLDVDVNAAFERVETNDQGLSAVELDAEGEEVALVSERQWEIELRGKESLPELPKTFTFATAKRDAELTYQRYDDADLAQATASIALDQTYGETSNAWLWLVALGVAAVAGVLLLLSRRRPATEEAEAAYRVPERVTPFTVLELLKRIQRDDGGAPADELATAIRAVEESFFSPDSNGDALDLRRLAERWVERGATPERRR